MNPKHQQNKYHTLDHLNEPTLFIRQCIAAKYTHTVDHVIEIGGGESPIVYDLLEFTKSPQSYVNIDIRFVDSKGLNYKGVEQNLPIPLISYSDNYRSMSGRHEDIELEELKRCKNIGGTVALVLLGFSVRSGYTQLIELASQCDIIIYEYRIGKEIDHINRFVPDLLNMGFQTTVSLLYLDPNNDDRKLLILDK